MAILSKTAAVSSVTYRVKVVCIAGKESITVDSATKQNKKGDWGGKNQGRLCMKIRISFCEIYFYIS